MIISVVGGKGGVGKTTVATNLALSLINVQFIDCDVEGSNSNIFLKTPLEESEDVKLLVPSVDKSKCDFCGKCSEFCMYGALSVVSSDVVVFPGLCRSCGGCELVCPKGAINYYEQVVGRIGHGSKGKIDFFRGLLNVGETGSSAMIKVLIKKIIRDKDVIIDTPSDLSFSLIKIIDSSDYCVLVTEPTIFGFHDLKRSVDVIMQSGGIPFGVIINRDGIGDKHVETFCSHEKIPVLLKIPYSKEIAELYAQGTPFINQLPVFRENFVNIFEKIRRNLRGETVSSHQS